MKLKYGVLDFRYNHEHFQPLKRQIAQFGKSTVNIGDNIQSIAARSLYHKLGIDDADIIEINRDELPYYEGPPATLIMNGCFYSPCFPVSSKIIPIFIGFNAAEKVIADNKIYLRRYEPIGCRDRHTALLCERHNIKAFTTGCVTLTLDKRTVVPSVDKTFLVYGDGSGALPKKIFKYLPEHLLPNLEEVYQRIQVKEIPVSDRESGLAQQYAMDVLQKYKQEATLVVTSLLHAACPCLALGIPVVLVRNKSDYRFSFIDKLTPIYTHVRFSTIDWAPGVIDVDNVKRHILGIAKYLIEEIPKKYYHVQALHDVYY